MSRNFAYIAVDTNGKRRRGVIEADTRDQAISTLRKQGLHATSMTDMGDEPDESAFGVQALLDQIGFTFVNQKAMAVYTRKLAGMINAGLTYIETFDILAAETDNRRLRYISTQVRDHLIKGNKVTEALSKFPNVFTKVYRSMIQAGETTGRLDHILNRLADMYDREFELRSNLKSKLYLPIIELIAGLSIVFVAVFAVPKFFDTYSMTPTQRLFSNVIKIFGFLIILSLLARTQAGYRIFRSILSVIPPFSGLMRKMSLARFSRLFAAMYGAGVPVMTGLDVAGETLMEPDLRYGLKHIKIKVNQGESLYDAIASSGVFPQSLKGMIRTGEKSGTVEETLNKLAQYYELEIDTQSSMLSSLFAVLVLVIVLLTLGLFVISMWSNYFGYMNEMIENT